MFGIGLLEMLILGMLCLMTVGVPIIVIVVVLWINRKNRGG